MEYSSLLLSKMWVFNYQSLSSLKIKCYFRQMSWEIEVLAKRIF